MQSMLLLLREANSADEIADVLNANLESIGFHYWLYSIRFSEDACRLSDYHLHNYPPRLWDEYLALKASPADPIASRCRNDVTPEVWMIERHGFDPGLENPLYGAARKAGITGGVCVPIRDHGILLGNLTVATCTAISMDWLLDIRSHAMLLAAHLHQACKRFISPPTTAMPQLSERELECLTWASRGKTSWEISRVLAISERTVIYHLQKAKGKLGAATRQQAVARSVALGLL